MKSLISVMMVVLFTVSTVDAQVKVKEHDLIGKWSTRIPGSKKKLIGVYEFKKMGLLTSEVAHLKMKVDANWKLKGDTIVMEVKKSSMPNLIPAGSISRQRIIEVTKSKIVITNKTGTVIIWEKLNK